MFAIASCIVLLCSCGGDNSSFGDAISDTGALNFNVVYYDSNGNLQSQAAVMDCVGLSVSTVEAVVYDPDGVLLAGSGPWDCDAGQGTIASVPAGAERTVVVLDTRFGTINVTTDSSGYIEFSSAKLDEYVTNNKGEKLYFHLKKYDDTYLYYVFFRSPSHSTDGTRPYLEIDTISQQ